MQIRAFIFLIAPIFAGYQPIFTSQYDLLDGSADDNPSAERIEVKLSAEGGSIKRSILVTNVIKGDTLMQTMEQAKAQGDFE